MRDLEQIDCANGRHNFMADSWNGNEPAETNAKCTVCHVPRSVFVDETHDLDCDMDEDCTCGKGRLLTDIFAEELEQK